MGRPPMVKELLLGDNPFIGVSHLTHEKARELQRELTTERKMEVMEAAIEAGATGFTFSTHPANLELLKYIKQQRPDILNRLNYYILVPYVVRYVREATKVGTPRLIKKILTTSISKDVLSLMTSLTPVNIIRLFLDAELEEYVKMLPRNNVKAILLHEVLTELIVAFDIPDIIKALVKYFKRKNIGFGLETRNILHVLKFLEENDLKVDYIMTPINPLGYQMTPSKKSAESAVLKLSTWGIKIIAINILASGAVSSIEEAVSYLKRFSDHIYAVAIGTSKAQRAIIAFALLRDLIT